MQLPIIVATLHTNTPVRERPAALRGYFGRRFPENTLLHQHMENGKTAYLYPRVQYRVTRGVPQIVAIAEGVTALTDIVDSIKDLDLHGKKNTVNFVSLHEEAVEIGDCENAIEYRFASPWLALSQKNYQRYKDADDAERVQLLQRIIVGNLLSLGKSFGIITTEWLEAKLFLRPRAVTAKRQRLIGFVGRFQVNYKIPDQLGIGHLVSIGFGEVALNQRVASST